MQAGGRVNVSNSTAMHLGEEAKCCGTERSELTGDLTVDDAFTAMASWLEAEAQQYARPALQLLFSLARLLGRADRMPTMLAGELQRKVSMQLRASRTSPSAATALVDEMRSLGFGIADPIQHPESLLECAVRAGACKRAKLEPYRESIPASLHIPFSAFGAWRDSRAFYERSGSSAWSGARDGCVPCLATSNSYVAACLARAALAFYADVTAADRLQPTAKPKRLVILEAGAGHAALTFLMANFLRDLRADVRVLLLATDSSERLMMERAQMPCFAPLLWDRSDSTQLVAVDFCALELTDESGSTASARTQHVLLHSRVPLATLGAEGACFFHVCCYVLDSLPADLYLLRNANGRCEASELRMPIAAQGVRAAAAAPGADWQSALSHSGWSDTALHQRYAGMSAQHAA